MHAAVVRPLWAENTFRLNYEANDDERRGFIAYLWAGRYKLLYSTRQTTSRASITLVQRIQSADQTPPKEHTADTYCCRSSLYHSPRKITHTPGGADYLQPNGGTYTQRKLLTDDRFPLHDLDLPRQIYSRSCLYTSRCKHMLPGGTRIICMIYCSTRFLRWISYYADPAQPLTTAGEEELDDIM